MARYEPASIEQLIRTPKKEKDSPFHELIGKQENNKTQVDEPLEMEGQNSLRSNEVRSNCESKKNQGSNTKKEGDEASRKVEKVDTNNTKTIIVTTTVTTTTIDTSTSPDTETTITVTTTTTTTDTVNDPIHVPPHDLRVVNEFKERMKKYQHFINCSIIKQLNL